MFRALGVVDGHEALARNGHVVDWIKPDHCCSVACPDATWRKTWMVSAGRVPGPLVERLSRNVFVCLGNIGNDGDDDNGDAEADPGTLVDGVMP